VLTLTEYIDNINKLQYYARLSSWKRVPHQGTCFSLFWSDLIEGDSSRKQDYIRN